MGFSPETILRDRKVLEQRPEPPEQCGSQDSRCGYGNNPRGSDGDNMLAAYETAPQRALFGIHLLPEFLDIRVVIEIAKPWHLSKPLPLVDVKDCTLGRKKKPLDRHRYA